MSINEVKEYFSKHGMENRILEFDASSATVDLAAQALNCEPKHIAKSLAFKLKKQGQTILIVAAGDTKIDNAKYKLKFGEKATMLTPEETVEFIGHAVGGVCPFAIHEDVKVYLDISLKRFETVFPACGSSNSAIELTIPELEKHSGFIEWIDVCKNWQ